MNIVQYSKMSNKEIMSKGMTTFRDASLFNINNKEQVDKMRTRLAQYQHEKIKSVDSFKELEKCQIMMFKEDNKMKNESKYKSQFFESNIINKIIQTFNDDEYYYNNLTYKNKYFTLSSDSGTLFIKTHQLYFNDKFKKTSFYVMTKDIISFDYLGKHDLYSGYLLKLKDGSILTFE